MTRREFDPVFSDALRSELERLSVAEGRPARTVTLPRPDVVGAHGSGWMRQSAIAGITLALVVAASVGAIQLARPAQHPAAVRPPADIVTPSTAPTPVPLPTALRPPTVSDKLTVVGTASGTDAAVTGQMRSAVTALRMTITCQGEGFLTIHTSDGSTLDSDAVGLETPGNECSMNTPKLSEIGLGAGGGMQQYGRLKYTITPHGNMVWAVTFTDID